MTKMRGMRLREKVTMFLTYEYFFSMKYWILTSKRVKEEKSSWLQRLSFPNKCLLVVFLNSNCMKIEHSKQCKTARTKMNLARIRWIEVFHLEHPHLYRFVTKAYSCTTLRTSRWLE